MQTTFDPQRLVSGIFVQEEKNRFLCTVRVNNEDIECYIPSSCRLSNFLDLSNKDVLLYPISKQNSRTKYSVYAVKHGSNYILLNLSRANRIVEEQLSSRRFSFLGKRKYVHREMVVNNYKSDLYIEDTKTIIEIKSILSFDKIAQFPSVYSERAIFQLQKISSLLSAGFRVYYIFISLNPQVKEICLNPSLTQYSDLFLECTQKGMACKAFSIRLKDNIPILAKQLTIRFNYCASPSVSSAPS